MMKLPPQIQALINVELANLNDDVTYNLPRSKRIDIYNAIGHSSLPSFQKSEAYLKELPNLTTADRVRTQLAIITARKVLPLWNQACLETDKAVNRKNDSEKEAKEQELEKAHLLRLQTRPIEEISVYDVPRKYIPSHILDMAEKVLQGDVHDERRFIEQSNEWWGKYPRPEFYEREFSIKWSAQEALYEAVGLVNYSRIPPIRDAINAYAGIFWGDTYDTRRKSYDWEKLNEFWHWWLTEAITQAWHLENPTS